jgi:hypothetical protein
MLEQPDDVEDDCDTTIGLFVSLFFLLDLKAGVEKVAHGFP